MDSRPFEARDLTALARERVRIGPTADWIDPAYYDKHFNPKIRGQVTPEKTHGSQRRSRGQKVEKRCVSSFYLFLGSFFGTFIGLLLGRWDSTTAIGGLIDLLVIPLLIWSLVLAILGLRECAKHPGRYLDSKVFAILTLVFGGLFSLFVFGSFIHGVRYVMTRASERHQIANANANAEPLDFKAHNFILTPPPPPWRQADSTRFGRNVLASFVHPERLIFTISSVRIPLLLADPVKNAADLAKLDMRHNSSSFTVIKEEAAEFNGLSGWQMNIQASIQGHDYYFVEWATATNGFGYELIIWGPAAAESEVKDEAAKICAGFQLIDSTKILP